MEVQFNRAGLGLQRQTLMFMVDGLLETDYRQNSKLNRILIHKSMKRSHTAHSTQSQGFSVKEKCLEDGRRNGGGAGQSESS